MEFSASRILVQLLVDDFKKEMSSSLLNDAVLYTFVSPSAYDTAWVAMIPDSRQPLTKPIFEDCLHWVLNNQREDGSWGECDAHGKPTIDSLPATLACMIALEKWNIGKTHVEKGKAFLETNIEKLLGGNSNNVPRWFAIVFPAMIKLAQAVNLKMIYPSRLEGVITEIFNQRQQILEKEEHAEKDNYPPLLAYLEALPTSYDNYEEHILRHLTDNDGSLFQSPSATARAFMATGDQKCLENLQSLVRKCANYGVPPTFPLDEDPIRLCIVNQLQRLGLAEYFNQEIEEVLSQVYWSYKNNEELSSQSISVHMAARQLFKDSLAFHLLRMHGYSVTPGMFCWFLRFQEIQDHIKSNNEYFSSCMLNVYRATDLMFPEEYEVQEVRLFARDSLEKIVPAGNRDKDCRKLPIFQNMIKHELDLPWLTRLEHLEHRMWIEERDANALWMGKTSCHRLSSFHNDKLMNLAKRNFEFTQSVYKCQLEDLKRWSKEMGLSDMGFGREKTTYCYFSAAASISLPHDSVIPLIVAKGAIIVTVADDFFDMRGSFDELKHLTDAVFRWDSKGLSGHSMTIFEALHNLVMEVSEEHHLQQGRDITNYLKDLWYETFASWLTEARWSRSGYIPSMDEYLKTGMRSIATHTLVLLATCLLTPSLPNHKFRQTEYDKVTKLLMLVTRLLNDTQSYQKEQKDGKTNFVLLYKKENPESTIEHSIAHVREIIARKEKELLEHLVMDELSNLSKPCKLLHLSCLKVFYMFYGVSNRYDTETELVQDIQNAIYVPLKVETTEVGLSTKPVPNLMLPLHPMIPKTNNSDRTVGNCYRLDQSSFREYSGGRSLQVWPRIRRPNIWRGEYRNMVPTPKLKLSFI